MDKFCARCGKNLELVRGECCMLYAVPVRSKGECLK